MYTRKKIFKVVLFSVVEREKKTYKTKEFLEIDISFSLDL